MTEEMIKTNKIIKGSDTSYCI